MKKHEFIEKQEKIIEHIKEVKENINKQQELITKLQFMTEIKIKRSNISTKEKDKLLSKFSS